MTKIALLIPDLGLHQALAEQLGALGTVIAAKNLPEALALTPEAIIAEPALLHEAEWPEHSPSLLFVIGSAGDKIPEMAITETFAKPIRLGHLLARLQLHLATQQQGNDPLIQLGAYAFYPRRRQIILPDEKVAKLTEKESALLAYLAAAAAPVSRDELLAAIWGYDGRIDTHTLETHIYRLRALPEFEQVPEWREAFWVKQGFYQLNPDLFKS